MKIGIVGATSGIAGKAYLPVYADLQDRHSFVLHSRDGAKAEALRQRYNFTAATADLSELESCDLVMIHAATSQHFALVERFLKAGEHVFVDKPLSEDLMEVEGLQQLAERQNRLLVVGFNRRFTPLTEKLKVVPDKNFIKVTKNLIAAVGDAPYKLYDVFIHPLDTLIYLLGDEILRTQHSVRFGEVGQLTQATLLLETATTTGLAMMNLASGAYSETFQVESAAGMYRLSDLTDYAIQRGTTTEHFAVNGWQSVAVNRGFDAMVRATFEAVEEFNGTNRTQLLQEELRQDNILTSHALIASLLTDINEKSPV